MTLTRRVVFALAALALASAPALAADNYNSDPAHSSVNFKIKHLDISYVFGRFDKIESKFTLTPDGSGDSFTMTINAESVDTGVKKRDDHLRGPDFFNAVQFPEVAFKSTSVKPVDKGYEVTGDLTLHGVTKPLTITLEKTGEADIKGPAGESHHVGLMADFTINRSDYGMVKMVGPVADRVDLMVSVDGIRK